MLNLSPALVKGAQRARVQELTELSAAYDMAKKAMSLDGAQGLPVLEQLAERFPREFTPARDTLRKHAEKDAKIIRLKAEIAAVERFNFALKNERGQKFLDTAASCAMEFPERFTARMPHVREIVALQMEIDESKRFDMRKCGYMPPEI